MTTAQMANVDLIMDSQYQAKRCSEWARLSSCEFICEYVKDETYYLVGFHSSFARIKIYVEVQQ